MKKVVLAASAVALLCVSTSVVAKDKKVIAPVNIDVPAGPITPIAATWASGVTPTLAADAVLPANTEVLIRTTSELNSKKLREGQTFVAVVANDITLGNAVVIPKNTPVNGVITWRTGKGVYGKSAKMEYEIRSFDLNGKRYGLTGKFRQEGKGNTGATVATAVLAGPIFGMFVTGKSAIVEQGRELKVYTATAIPVTGGAVAAPAAAPATATPAAATTAEVPAAAQPASTTK
jgi:hypothetical protein